MGIDEVLLARMTSGRVTAPSVRKISRFASRSSVAASITRSDASSPASSVTPVTRPRSASASAASSLPRSTALATERSTEPRPRATSSSVPSTNVTCAPLAGDDLDDAGAHQAAAHDTHLANVLRIHGLSGLPSLSGRKPTIQGMSARRRLATLGVAVGGVLVGHWLTYLAVAPIAGTRATILHQTGHSYLGLANDLALVAALAAMASMFIAQLTTDRAIRGISWGSPAASPVPGLRVHRHGGARTRDGGLAALPS